MAHRIDTIEVNGSPMEFRAQRENRLFFLQIVNESLHRAHLGTRKKANTAKDSRLILPH